MQLTSLNAEGYGISNLTGLQYAVNMQFLNLANNDLTALLLPNAGSGLDNVPLGQILTQLKYIDLDGNVFDQPLGLAGDWRRQPQPGLANCKPSVPITTRSRA